MRTIISRFIVILATLTIYSCNGEIIGSGYSIIQGTAAIGRPIVNAKVEIKSTSGALDSTFTDTEGKFNIPAINPDQPHLLRITLADNSRLYSFASSTGISNIHPFTDLIIRNWFAVHNMTIDEEFDANTALSQPLTAAEIDTIKQKVKELLALALTDYGLPAELDLISTPFDANGTGFDRFLDNSAVTILDEQVTITVTSSDQSSTTVILEEADLAEDLTVEDTTLPSAPSQVLGVNVDDSRILLIWNESSDNFGITGYTIQRDGQFIGNSAYPEYLDTGLSLGTEYCYAVTAIDAAGNESAPPSTTAPCPFTKSVVDAPPLFNMYPIPRGNAIELRWDTSTIVNIDQVANYELTRFINTDPANVVNVAIFPAAELPSVFFDTGLNLLANYCYDLRALDINGELVAPSTSHCAIPGSISPPAPILGINETAFLFAVEKYYVKETDGSVNLVVNRFGDLSQQFEVSLNARSGTAIAGNDFVDEPGSNTVIWNTDDDLPKSYTMTINTDAISEPTEYLYLEIKDQNQNLLNTATLVILE